MLFIIPFFALEVHANVFESFSVQIVKKKGLNNVFSNQFVIICAFGGLAYTEQANS